MKKLAIATVALGSMLSVVSGVAHADAPEGPSGFLCGFSSSDDSTGTIANPGTQVGELDGGPLVMTDTPANFTPTTIDVTDPTNPSVTPGTVTPDPSDATDNPVSGSITCGLQVNGTGVYTDPDAVSATSATTTGVAYLPPSVISYAAGANDAVYVTTSTVVCAYINGILVCVWWYYDYPSGNWVSDPAQAHGDLAISQQIPPQEVCDLAPPACP